MVMDLEQTAQSAVGICLCGRKYNLVQRKKEAGNCGSAAEYCSDNCWVEYTSSQDALEPCLTSSEK